MDISELNRSCSEIFEGFAQAAERMNAFSRTLRESPTFYNVITGADIRRYTDGWRIEKYIEAKLKHKEDQFAVWWLQMSFDGIRWKIDTNNGLTGGDYHHEFPSRFVVNTTEIGKELELATEDLENSFLAKSAFRIAIEG